MPSGPRDSCCAGGGKTTSMPTLISARTQRSCIASAGAPRSPDNRAGSRSPGSSPLGLAWLRPVGRRACGVGQVHQLRRSRPSGRLVRRWVQDRGELTARPPVLVKGAPDRGRGGGRALRVRRARAGAHHRHHPAGEGRALPPGRDQQEGWRSALARDRPLEPGSKKLTGWNVDPRASFVLRPGPGGCLL
jgi:hypothetical protein